MAYRYCGGLCKLPRWFKTHLSIIYHSPDHALGQFERRQIACSDFAQPLPMLSCSGNVFVQPGERGLALILVEAIIVRIAAVRKHPIVFFIRCGIGNNVGLLGRAVKARVAFEGGAELAKTAAGGQDFLDERGQRWAFGSGSVEDGEDEQEDKGAYCSEERGQGLDRSAPEQHGGGGKGGSLARKRNEKAVAAMWATWTGGEGRQAVCVGSGWQRGEGGAGLRFL